MPVLSTASSIVNSWKKAVISHVRYLPLLNVTLGAVWLPGTAILTGLLLAICPEQNGHRSNEGQATKWSF